MFQKHKREITDEENEKICSQIIIKEYPYYEISIDSVTINIHKKVKECINKSEVEIINYFSDLFLRFIDTCKEYNIRYKLASVRFILSDEMTRPQCGLIFDKGILKPLQKAEGKSIDICFPTEAFTISLEFAFLYILHELSHCWLDLEYRNHKTMEYFADLFAMCVLEKIVSNKKIYQKTIRMSYIGSKDFGARYFGKETQNKILDDPKSFLKVAITKPNYASFENLKYN